MIEYTVTMIDRTKDETWPPQEAEDYADLIEMLTDILEGFLDDFQAITDDKERNRLRSKARRLQKKFKDWYEEALDDELGEGGPVDQTVDDGGKGVILRIAVPQKTPAS